jgi:hypothetical protein
MNHYQGGVTAPWEENRKHPYRLVDFLPPVMQSTLNKTLPQEYIEFPTDFPRSWANPKYPMDAPEFETGMNCWDAAYNYLWSRGQSWEDGKFEMRVFHIGAVLVDFLLKNESYYQSKFNIPLDSIPPYSNGRVRNKGRKFGDLMILDTLANAGIGAVHAAIWIDDDLFYEKTDMGEDDPFRLAYYDVSIQFWVNEYILSDELFPPKLTFYRYKVGKLPDPLSLTGHYFYYDWVNQEEDPESPSEDELPKKYREKYIFNLDVSLGGSLGTYRINPVYPVFLEKSKKGKLILNAGSLPSGIEFSSLYNP